MWLYRMGVPARSSREKRVSANSTALFLPQATFQSVSMFSISSTVSSTALMSHLQLICHTCMRLHHVPAPLDHHRQVQLIHSPKASSLITARINSWADEGIVWIDENNASMTPAGNRSHYRETSDGYRRTPRAQFSVKAKSPGHTPSTGILPTTAFQSPTAQSRAMVSHLAR